MGSGDTSWSSFDFSTRRERYTIKRKESVTRICIPLSESFDNFKIDNFMDRLIKRWDRKLQCQEMPVKNDLQQKIDRYRLSDMDSFVVISSIEQSLPAHFIDEFVASCCESAIVREMEEHQNKALLSHVHHILLENSVTRENGVAQTTLIGQILLSILEYENAIGHAALSAELYCPKEWAESYLRDQQFGAQTLFLLFGNIHSVTNREQWIHTHGMEQFGLPDIEIVFNGRDKLTFFTELVSNVAISMIGNGKELSNGDTIDYAGSGNFFKVVEARKRTDHSFGDFGAKALIPI